MNFNSDFQSNENRLCTTREVINLSLNATKTKPKSKYHQFFRFSLEIAFVIFALSIGYIQGLKSFKPYKIDSVGNSKNMGIKSLSVPISTVQMIVPSAESEQNLTSAPQS